MPANNVDLSAVLPVLKTAVAPFEAAMTAMASVKINPATRVRTFAPIAGLTLGDVQKLVDAVSAVRRMAGDMK